MIGWDLETFLTEAAFQAPLPVCATTWTQDGGPRLWHTWELEACMAEVLRHDVIVLHNGAFDFAVIAEWYPHLRPLIWAAYREGRVYDTMLGQRIIEIQKGERGKLALDMVAMRNGLHMTAKAESQHIRTTFGQFYNKVIPEGEHREYALADAQLPMQIRERQLRSRLVSARDMKRLAKKAFWQHLVSASGFVADPERIAALEQKVTAQLAVMQAIAVEAGFVRENGTRNKKAIQQAIVNAYGYARVPLTDKRNVRTDAETLEDSGNADLVQLMDWGGLLSVRNKDLKLLREAGHHPLHSLFGVADTLRTTTKRPNQQNFGKLGGVRECIVPRAGCFVLSDFSNLENVTLAQLIYRELGLSNMRDMLNNGIDLHARVAQMLLQIPYDEVIRRKKTERAVKEARDMGKPANYGLAGGMNSPLTFQRYARGGYNVKMDLETTIRVMLAWKEMSPDQMAWREAHGAGWPQALGGDGRFEFGDVQLPNSDIIRRNVAATIRANTPFQALGAETADEAGWLLSEEQYLYGRLPGRVSLFIHDEFGTDCEESAATEVAQIQERCMIEAAANVLPDMKMKVDTKAVDRYSKDGESIWVAGKLQMQRLAA